MDSVMLYLKPAIERFTGCPSSITQLVKTINSALSQTTNQAYDVHFTKVKIGVLLLNSKLQTYDNLEFGPSGSSFASCGIVLSWSSLITVCLECCMMVEMTELLFKLDYSVICVVLEDIVGCMHIPMCGDGEGVIRLNLLDSVVSSLCILCTSLKSLLSAEVSFSAIPEDNSDMGTALRNLVSFIEHSSLNDALLVKRYHINNILSCINLINVSTTNTSHSTKQNLNIVALHKLKSVTLDKLDLKKIQDIQQIQKVVSSNDPEFTERHLPVVVELSKLVEKVCGSSFLLNSEQFSETDAVLYSEFSQNIRTLNDAIPALIKSQIPNVNSLNNAVGEKCAIKDLDQAISIVSKMLDGYDQATEFIMNHLLTSSYSNSYQKCIDVLISSQPCLLLGKHAKMLLKLINMAATNTAVVSLDFTNPNAFCDSDKCYLDCLKSMIDLLYWTLKNLIQSVQMDFLNYTLENIFHFENEDFHGNAVLQFTSDHIHQQVHILFNTLTHFESTDNSNELLSSFIVLSSLQPFTVLSKIVEQIVLHQEHHSLMLFVLRKLSSLATISDKSSKKNAFVSYLFRSLIKSEDTKLALQSADFICELCPYDGGKVNDFRSIFKPMLHENILPFFSESKFLNLDSQQKLSLTMTFLGTMFKDSFLLDEINVKDIIIILFLLSRILDTNIQWLTDSVRSQLIDMIQRTTDEALCTLEDTPEESTATLDALHWFNDSCKCFCWTTQLLIRPLLSQLPNYSVTLPRCIQTVCRMPSDCCIDFKELYGDGLGLVAWMQCLILDPSFLPVSSLLVNNLTYNEQSMFVYGLVLSMSQILPHSVESDWTVIISALEALIVKEVIPSSINLGKVKYMPFVDLEHCSIPLTLMGLLDQVTNVVASQNVSASWLTEITLGRLCKYYAITIKECFDRFTVRQGPRSNLFMASQMFSYACNAIALLKTTFPSYESCIKSIFVLCLDFLGEIGRILDISSDTAEEQLDYDDVEVTKTLLITDILHYKVGMEQLIPMDSSQESAALIKKLSSIVHNEKPC